MQMNNGKTILVLLSLNKTEVCMSLCFAHAGNIVPNVHALSFVVHFSIEKGAFRKKKQSKNCNVYFRKYEGIVF